MQNHTAQTLVSRLLSVIANDIVPLTQNGVAAGNKIFGAALLLKSDLSLVLAETNNEMENPLWHGEMHTLKRFYEIPSSERPNTDELIFLSTHEPCSLCLSAITWAGFDNFYYFFSHEDSRDSFAIPHDLRILKEVFDVDPGGYKTSNEFWQCHAIKEMAKSVTDSTEQNSVMNQIKHIYSRYDELSTLYQNSKDNNDIPLN